MIKQRNEEISLMIQRRIKSDLQQVSAHAKRLSMSYNLNKPSSLILEKPLKKIKLRKSVCTNDHYDETTSRTKTATKYVLFYIQ